MTDPEAGIAADRANRNAARGVFAAHVARLRGDVAAHGGVAGKVKDEAGRKLLASGKHGLAIARESKGIVAGALAALGLWLFRKPLLAALQSHFAARAAPAAVQEPAARPLETAKEMTE